MNAKRRCVERCVDLHHNNFQTYNQFALSAARERFAIELFPCIIFSMLIQSADNNRPRLIDTDLSGIIPAVTR